MTGRQHIVLASVVTHDQWQNGRRDLLQAAHATLRERAEQQGLQLLEPPEEIIEILPGKTRVRITLSAESVASSSVASSSVASSSVASSSVASSSVASSSVASSSGASSSVASASAASSPSSSSPTR